MGNATCDASKLSMEEFLSSVGLSSLNSLFAKELITLDVLSGMTHDDLKAVGINAFGVRFRLLKNVEKYLRGNQCKFFLVSKK